MIAAKYNTALIKREFITELATETASDIYRVQTGIAQVKSLSGKSYRMLAQKPFTVTGSGSGVRLVMKFPLSLRYMDMKTDYRTGRKKQNYVPVYNKIVWGFIYGYLYKQLIYGISRDLNEAIVKRLRAAGYKMQ